MTTESSSEHTTITPLPADPDFPVAWEHPEDERLFWEPDRMHFPEPITPMMLGWNQAFNEGFRRASQTLELPIRLRYQRINTHNYAAIAPTVPPEEMEAQGKRSEEKLQQAMGRLEEAWESELLPEVMEHLSHWEAFDLAGASMPDLAAHMDDTWNRLTRLWDIHFLAVVPIILAMGMFDDVYGDLFGKEGALDSFRLLRGFGNKTVEGGHVLWELSRTAMNSTHARAALQDHDAADVPAALEASAEGRAFLAELGTYLEEYGQRSDVFVELGNPNWIENPATPLKNLKDFINQPDRDLRAELATLAAERERLVEECQETLKGYPVSVREQFAFVLKAGQAGTVIQEDHNYWIDQRAHYKVRRVLLELGRRIAEAGPIEQPSDVFYLSPDELRETSIASPEGYRRKLVAERKAEMDHFSVIQQPSALGTMPDGPPPDDPLSRAMGKFFGVPPEPSTEPNVLQGNAGSPGKTTGTAKVIPSLAEAGRLEPGDILVAPATMPAWTPLFASISAVVTDAGGVLSHAAIVAREYNIPAVLGTGNATSVIQDGQTIEVDGDSGVVRIVS